MKLVLFFSLFALSGCSDEIGMQAPVGLIPAEKFIPIIVDLQVLESHYHRLYVRPDLYRNALDSSSNFVFQKYGVTKPDFESSFSYYSSEINVIYTIYEAALDSINFRINQKSF